MGTTSVVSTSKDGLKRRVVYQGSVLSPYRNDSLSFAIDYVHEDGWTVKAHLIFNFDDLGEPFTSNILPFRDTALNCDGQNWTLHKWNSPTFVEVSVPVKFDVMDSNGAARVLWFKFRTQATEGQDYRSFILTVWLQD